MDVIGVIPARYSSTRFDGKVLIDILGKPMIQHVWEKAKQASMLDDLIIACDDERIKKVAEEFGAKVILTAKGHLSGTDRIAEIVNPIDVKVIINIQADEPLIHPSTIDSLSRALLFDKNCNIASLMKKIEDPAEINDHNVVKVVTDKNGHALYFSRSTIPFVRNHKADTHVYFKHLGIYAYTKDFLFTFKNLPISNLEKLEALEQLRVLEHGYKIKMIETNFETVGVDTPADLDKVINILSRK
ncbi:MAG: 3-deoxy-manno-octulosonate cytidylyltransferase [Candidatus Omnitrophota bacterium]